MSNKRTYQLDEETTITDDMTLLIDDASFAESKQVKVPTLLAAVVASGNYVPYSGATETVDLGAQLLQAGTGKFGDVSGGDYAGFLADGTLQLYGAATVFRDEKNDVVNLKVAGTGVSINPTESTAEFTNASDLSDYLYVNVQLNHDRKLESNIYPHIHYFANDAVVPNFLLEYRWQVDGGAKTTAWTQLICNNAAFPYVSGTINQLAYSAPITPPVNDMLSDIVQFKIYRDNANTSTLFLGADKFPGTVGILSFDVHIELDSMGSHEEFDKI